MTAPKSKLRIAFNVVCYVLLALLVTAVIVLFVGKVKNRPAFFFGKTMLWVRTDSMENTIPAQSYILVSRADPAEIEAGDVITFYSDDPLIKGELNTHRVVEVIGDHEAFRTKGDHNPIEDKELARAENVVAVYRKNLPALTAFGRLMATGGGIAVSALLVLLMVCAVYLPDILKAARKADRAEQERDAEIEARVAAEVARMREEARAAGEQAPEKDETDAKENDEHVS